MDRNENETLSAAIFRKWLEVEEYLQEFKRGELDNFDICKKTLRELAVKEMQLVTDLERSKNGGKDLEIPVWVIKK